MLKKIMPHILIILSTVLLVFFIIDQVNSAMCFINNNGTKIIIGVQSALTLICSAVYVVQSRKKEK